MKSLTVNAMNNVFGWASISAILWAWLMDWLPIDTKSVVIFFIFLVLATLAGLSERAHNTPEITNG